MGGAPWWQRPVVGWGAAAVSLTLRVAAYVTVCTTTRLLALSNTPLPVTNTTRSPL
jgi:Asp/Glu/hydantoin racemase